MNKDFLSRATELASQVSPYKTRPNPRVGCVVVRDGKIIAEGVHEEFGGAHAEVNAFENLSPGLKNSRPGLDAEVYVTLEPCDRFEGKKTPSCTELLIQKKPKKIIIGTIDPKFQGKNIEKLRQAGIEVEVRNCEACETLNPFWHKFATTGMPYVTLKLAQSLDGRITRINSDTNPKKKGFVSYISNELSRKRVHEMRAQYSAILTTTETVLTDDPRLDCRRNEFVTPPNPLLIPFDLAQGRQEGGIRNSDIIVIGKREIPRTAKIFSIPDRKIHFFPTHDLKAVLEQCGTIGIDSVLMECGAIVTTLSLQKNLIDEVQMFIAPEIFGTGKNSFVGDRYICPLRDFTLTDIQNLEGDVWMKFQKKN